MKVAYFDCQFGAAGDMLTAALLDCGLDADAWQSEVAKIDLPAGSYSLQVSRTVRQAMAASKLDVYDRHGHLMDSGHEDGQHGHRGLAEIEQILTNSKIRPRARELACRIFRRLARAEGLVHGIEPEAVHFHEVGAIDAIVDVTGFAIAYEMLGIDMATVSALPLGGGMSKSEHGMYPAPGPATVHLLKEAGAATSSLAIDFECLTPTGAAILCEIASGFASYPTMDELVATGAGAGTKDTSGWPNICRVLIGVVQAQSTARFDQDTVAVIEANLDDCSPQLLAHAQDTLLAKGALDVTVIPAIMKKGRSGHVLCVLTRPADLAKMQEFILSETTTIGVRSHLAQRLIASRRWQEVRLSDGGCVRIKIASDRQGNVVNLQPEYEDCRRHAGASGRALKDIAGEALAVYKTGHRGS